MGAGQTPGETIGNGRASAILYAREGAKVIVVDYRLNSAEDTCQMIAKEGGDLDSGAKCNRAKQTGFARLCQAL